MVQSPGNVSNRGKTCQIIDRFNQHMKALGGEGDPGLPANPQNQKNVPVIPNDLQETNNGNRFLLYDSRVGNANRIIIFVTDLCLDLLRQSDHWFGDGPFSGNPAIYFQVYTIHAICNGNVLPCMYVLLLNKAGPTYDALFHEI